MLKKSIVAVALVGIGIAAGSGALHAQLTPAPGGIKRTILQKVDVAGTNSEMILAIVEVPAGTKIGRHTHPGTATGYVAEGAYSFTFDGEPAKTVNVGESMTIPAGKIHDESTGDKPAKLIVVYVVEKGKPLVAPEK